VNFHARHAADAHHRVLMEIALLRLAAFIVISPNSAAVNPNTRPPSTRAFTMSD
jgi:hypothetical protein